MSFNIEGYSRKNDNKEKNNIDHGNDDKLYDLNAFEEVEHKNVIEESLNLKKEDSIEKFEINDSFEDLEENTSKEINTLENVITNNSDDNCNIDHFNSDKDNCNERKIDYSQFDTLCNFVDSLSIKDMLCKCKDISKKTIEFASPLTNRLKRKCKCSFQKGISFIQGKSIRHKFKNGSILKGANFTFALNDDNELMLLRYTGSESVLKIPDSVQGFRVTQISNNFLNFQRITGVANTLRYDEIGDTDVDRVTETLSGIKEIRLPVYLKRIPSKCFSSCRHIETLVIPENVVSVDPKAFSRVKIDNIIFMGNCPRGLDYVKISKDTTVFCTEVFKDSFDIISSFKIDILDKFKN